MATKNIVPNADGEGQLGTSSKSWAQGHIDSITGTIATAAQGSITSLGTLTALSISGDLTVSGGDITLGAAATAGTLSLVASAHGAVGNSLTISGGSTTAGTTNDIAGGSLILTGGAGKGTGDGGSVIIKSATKGSSGSSLNAIDDTIATFASDLSTTFAGGVAVAGASSLPLSDSSALNAGIQIPTNAQLGFGNGATNKPDFGFAVQGTSGDAKLNIFCGTGGTAVDAFFDTNGFFNAAALKVADSGTIGTTSTANAMTIASNGEVEFTGANHISGASSLRAQAKGGTLFLDTSADAQIRTNGTTTALTLDASQNATFAGNVGIGDSAFNYYANSLVVKAADEGGVTFLSSATDAKFYLAFADGTADHTQELAGMITFDHENNQMALGGNAGVEHLKIANNGNVTVTDGDLIIGTAGHGIDFAAESPSGSGSANTILDDYEEGTFTATILNLTGSNPTVTGAGSSAPENVTGQYVKIGQMVHIQYNSGEINISNLNGGSSAAIGGLPFASASGHTGVITVTHSVNFSAAVNNGFISSGSSSVGLVQDNTTNYVNWVASGDTFVMIGGTYITTT